MPNNNKQRSSQLRSKRFYKYFLSYISLLLILLMVVGGVVYNSFITTLPSIFLPLIYELIR